MDSFSGRRRRDYLKFPSLGSPRGVEKRKKHTLEGSHGRGNPWPLTARAADGARFFDDSWVSELKRVLTWNFGSFWQASGNAETGEE